MMVAACSAQAEPSPTDAAGRATAQPASTSATRQPTNHSVRDCRKHTATPGCDAAHRTRRREPAYLPGRSDSLERLASRFGLHLAVGTYYAFSLDDTLLVVQAFDPEAATEAVGALSR